MATTHRVVVAILQAGLALAGIAWKIGEDLPAYEVPDPNLALEDLKIWMHILQERPWTWKAEILSILQFKGLLPASLIRDWPWFSLHFCMYVSQFIPLVGMMVMESVRRKKTWAAFCTVFLLSLMSTSVGVSSAMPFTSILFLTVHRLPSPLQGLPQKEARERTRIGFPREELAGSPWRRLSLGLIFLTSTVAHIGAWTIALSATFDPSLFSTSAAEAFHVMHSLCGVPSDITSAMASAAANSLIQRSLQAARLRQINEMVGTSSGFLVTVGLLCDALTVTGRHLSVEGLVWMFCVSLVAGPAAGGAVVLLTRDWLLGL